MKIRTATLEDRSVLDDLISRSYGDLFRGWYDEELLSVALPLMSKANPKLLESGTYYVAEEQGRVIAAGGWTGYAPSDLSSVVGVGHIRHFATDPDHLRKGAARKIMTHSMEAARQAGIRRLECVSSLPAETFYSAVGFLVDRRDMVAFTEELSIPAVFMSRELEV